MKTRWLGCVLGTLALFMGLTVQAQQEEVARIRLVHLAPFANTVAGTSVTLAITPQGSTDAALLFPNVVYEAQTGYAPVPPGTYTISVIPTGADDPVLQGDVELAGRTDYTAAVIGNITEQPLEVLLIEDLNRNPEEGFFRARFVHAAPVAANINDTLVDISDEQRVLIDDFAYKEESDFGRTNPGTVIIDVTGPTGSPVLVSPLPFDIAAGYVGTLFVIGDASNQPLRLYALPRDPETDSPSGELQIATTCTTGSWFQPSTDGQGINLEAIANQNRMIGYWYTFSADGAERVWYYMDGQFSGAGNAANLTVFERTGASFNAGVADEAEVVGTFDITFPSETTATAAFNITDQAAGLNSAEGILNLQRLSPIQGDSCDGFIGAETDVPQPAPLFCVVEDRTIEVNREFCETSGNDFTCDFESEGVSFTDVVCTVDPPQPPVQPVICLVEEVEREIVIENVECEDGSDIGSACTVTFEGAVFEEVVCRAVNP
jgi:hypothetical protein